MAIAAADVMQPTHKGILTAVLAVCLGACGSTSVTNTWKSPSVRTMAMHKVLTIAYVPTESIRRSLEDRLVRELAKEGVAAVPSHRLVDEVKTLDRDSVRALVRKEQCDAVLVANYLGTTRDVDYVPAMTYYDYFGYRSSPGMVKETTEVKLEFMLFDSTDQGRMVWSAMTSTVHTGKGKGKIPDVADNVIARLEDDRGR